MLSFRILLAYLQLLDDVGGALKRSGLEREHGVVAIKGCERGSVGVEGLVVEFDELLCLLVSKVRE